MTEVIDPELIPIYPIEQSMSGRNSTYRFCEQRGQAVAYAVCLHTLRRIEDNTLPAEIAVECQRGYCHNNCIAKKMKAEEVAAGHALYWEPRRTHITDPVSEEKKNASGGAVSTGKYDMSNASYARGWAIGGGAGEQRDRPAPKKRPPPPPPKPKSSFIEATGADLVNAVMAEKPKVATPVPKAAAPAAASNQPMRPAPGESMPDFIKRRAAALKG